MVEIGIERHVRLAQADPR